MALFCAVFAAIATSACAETCQLKLISSLTVTETSDHLFVPVVIAGKQLRFNLQLGDAYTGITAKEAKELKLSEVPMPEDIRATIGNKPITTLVNVPLLEIDRAIARDRKLFEFPSLAAGDGELGLDILAVNDLELDLAHHKVNLFSRDHCIGKVIYWTPPGNVVAIVPLSVQKSGDVMADMSVDGKVLSVGFTTADHSRIEMPAAYRMFGIEEHSPGLLPIEADEDGSPQYRYPFREIGVEGLNIKNPDIVVGGKSSDPDCDPHQRFMTLTESADKCFGGGDLRLGKTVLRRLHLFFAFGEKVLYVTAASN